MADGNRGALTRVFKRGVSPSFSISPSPLKEKGINPVRNSSGVKGIELLNENQGGEVEPGSHTYFGSSI